MNDRLPIIRKFFDDHPLKQDQGTYAAQKLVSSLLKELNEICEREGISYFLYGGCLIGAVRHGGYIPWDDDIDIVMTSKDLEKLEKAISGSKYSVSVPKWLHKFKKDDFPALVDILPAIETYSNLDEHQCRRQFFIMREVGLTYHKTPLSKTIENVLSESYNQPGGTNRYISTKISNPYDANYKLSGVPYDRIYPLRKVKLGDADAYIPRDPEYLLNLQFGSYYDLPLFRRGSHVSHKSAVSYCQSNGIEIIKKNKVDMEDEYNRSMAALYGLVTSTKGLQHEMIAMLMEFKGVGTKKDSKSALKRLESRFGEVSSDPFYFNTMYDLLCDVGGRRNLEKADRLVMDSDSSDPGVVLRRGRTAIRRKDQDLYRSVLNEAMAVDLSKAVVLVDAVMEDPSLLDALDPYDCCCSLAESGFRKAIVYKAVMEIYGIHCVQSIDIDRLSEISVIRGMGDTFYSMLWSLRGRSPSAFFMVCSCLSTSSSMRYGFLGRAYRDGIGVQQDLNAAAVCMRKAMEMKLDWAGWEYFLILWNIGTPESLKDMVRLGESESGKGDPYIRAGMARAYREGKGVEKDLSKAAELMLGSTKRGPSFAKGDYVDILLEIGTPECDKAAFEFAHAVKGRARRTMDVREARMYREGRGVKKDLGKAAACMRRAVANGVRYSPNELFDILWDIDTPKTDAEMVAVARDYAEEGNGGAMGRLGRAYRDGRGVKKDLVAAAEWYRKSAAKKVKWAADELKELR